ncbi:MAG: AAA family ATPase [Flavobacteriales bacterium]|nr:AAA family ATPase [Flavobacteriales bacterium]
MFIVVNKMEALQDKYLARIRALKLNFERSAIDLLDTEHRLIGIKGPRGTGKTTMLLQYARKQANFRAEVLYASLDSFWFAGNSLYRLADEFVKKGGRTLLLDEVHKYTNWAQELKNIYDDFADLKVIFTGSSLLEILTARADLSRRAVVYELQGLSFREYIALETGRTVSVVDFDDLISGHAEIAAGILEEVKPFAHLDAYLRHGYYPFYNESVSLYPHKLEAVINMILEVELPQLRALDVAYTSKLRQLLSILAESAPFVPNATKLSERIGINRLTLLQYLHHLRDAGLLIHLNKQGKGISQLQKPAKLYLDNTNLAYLLSEQTNTGTLRETFFANQVGVVHDINYTDQGDFLVAVRWSFEVGG